MTSTLNFDEIRIFEDCKDDLDIIREIIDTEKTKNGFHILDVGDVMTKHKNWISKIPKVVPHFAMKCNPNLTVIKVLAALNAGFDCASQYEIEKVIEFGVTGDRIIFANPTKLPAHIEFARRVNVSKMTIDNEEELLKIKELFPDAKIIIRFQCVLPSYECHLSAKFGCDPDQEAINLIQATKNLGMNLYGFSFHVGSPCDEPVAYKRGIEVCKRLIGVATSMGCNNVRLIDIGGGIPGDKGFELDEYAEVVNEALKNLDPSIEVISEPGRYYVASASSVVSYLHSKKIVPDGDNKKLIYYVSDGVYGSFIEELLNIRSRLPISLDKRASKEKFVSTIWGPTCDAYDCIVKDVLLPEFFVGDWLVWKNMGAYAIALATSFNGFFPPAVYPIMRKSTWETLLNDFARAGNLVEPRQ
ncbi:ornithine decarboxylase 1 isoform X2 [Cephus cinctus]|uniref:Ornithine decarboxylase 1 isoform X2 n=1 Tax=Cephus cinctus TaxID=211228 RepID=A0AAJ7BIJ3_CEPCN|nr:ornithine decarboxylase 1 isoform X2 [Cephus cinctus]